MANEELLRKILQSVDDWNQWRSSHPNAVPDLTNADLSGRDLTGADLSGTRLDGANFTRATLDAVDFSQACLEGAVFAATNLLNTSGLRQLDHTNKLSIDLDTLFRSKGSVPAELLESCGVPVHELSLMVELFCEPRRFYSCFISYSSKDSEFAELLAARLRAVGVETWLASTDMRVGSSISKAIVQQIESHERFILVVSESALHSTWVRTEVECALVKLRQGHHGFLIPIQLELGQVTPPPWYDQIKQQWHILEFMDWRRKISFDASLESLIELLNK